MGGGGFRRTKLPNVSRFFHPYTSITGITARLSPVVRFHQSWCLGVLGMVMVYGMFLAVGNYGNYGNYGTSLGVLGW